jgi:hypothetical protein
MPVSSPSESRARQLLSKGANDDAVAQATGLSKGAVITIRRAMKLPPEKPHVSAPLPADREPPAAPVARAAQRESNEVRQRRGMPAAFKDWDESDYKRFIDLWQATPNVAKAAASENVSEEDIEWLVGKMKQNGVMLKRATVLAFDFSKLAPHAASLLTEEERKELEAKKAKAKERMTGIWAKKKTK